MLKNSAWYLMELKLKLFHASLSG